jgi:hypothetical protein
MSDDILPPDYKTQWPALFLDWAAAKLAEWEKVDRSELSAARQLQLEYDKAALEAAVVRLTEGR